MPRIVRTDSFLEQFCELDKRAQQRVLKTLRLLGINPKHPSLQVYRIKGTPFWEAHASKSIRVVFQRENETLTLLACGYHDILKKY